MFAPEPAAGRFDVHKIPVDCWQPRLDAAGQAQATRVLEDGGLILLPQLAFAVGEHESRLLGPDCVRTGSKHLSFDMRTGELRGAAAPPDPASALRRVMQRYATQSHALVCALFPHYAPNLQVARTSFRPFEAGNRAASWRKDDRRLHVDAFPSTPNQGRRLLRVFSNVNQDGRERVWQVGEPFEAVARRFLPLISRRSPGFPSVLRALRITRGLRTEYDRIMLRLHDRMKADAAYQASAAPTRLQFPPGSTWIVQTDAVSHAALHGQFMFEQTFLLPVHGMLDPARSPLRILERLTGRRLA